jgi:hypothetical protein
VSSVGLDQALGPFSIRRAGRWGEPTAHPPDVYGLGPFSSGSRTVSTVCIAYRFVRFDFGTVSFGIYFVSQIKKK